MTKFLLNKTVCYLADGTMYSFSMRSMSTVFKCLILLSIMPLIGLSQESVEYSNLTKRNDVYFKINSSVPYTGSVYSLYDDGKLFLNGDMMRGEWIWSISYHRSGQKQFENHYKNGVRHGTQLWWYENGQLKSTQSYENGLLHGISKSWWEDGRIMGLNTYVNGIQQN